MLQKKLTSNFLLWWGGRSAEQRVRFATAGRNLYRTANRSEQLYFPVGTVVSLFTDRPASSRGDSYGGPRSLVGSIATLLC